jgi:hypothetical protein
MTTSMSELGASLRRRGRSGAVLVIAATMILTMAVGGCSKNTSSTGASSTTAATGTASSGPGNSSSPSGSAVPSATASAHFVGEWHVHDSSLNVALTTATLTASSGMGPCMQNPQAPCSETDQLAVTSGNDTQLTLTVTGVSYTFNDFQTATVNPSPGPRTAVGDSIQLVWQAPGLLKATVLKGLPGMQGGNPYWCGAGVSQTDAQKCGA